MDQGKSDSEKREECLSRLISQSRDSWFKRAVAGENNAKVLVGSSKFHFHVIE